MSPTPTSQTFAAFKTSHPSVCEWVEEMKALCEPDSIYWCDGSEEEKQRLTQQAVDAGVLIPLNQKKLPGCYLHRSNPNDVARVEDCTFICTRTPDAAGPTNHWMAPAAMYEKLYGMCKGAMKGRTMYVVPYLMGMPGSPLAKVGVELTDSIYVVLSMRIMARMGQVAWDQLGSEGKFTKGLHSMLDVNPERRFIAHFPQDNTIISVGSNYGGNVLLGKKCLALRLGSYLGRIEGWMAEHMLILGVESPEGQKTYVAAAFPSACGKTNFRDADSTEGIFGLEDHDDRRRHRVDEAGARWPAVRHQPGGRLLRRGAGHEFQVEPERDDLDAEGHDLHQRGADCPTAMSGGKARMASRPRSVSTGRASLGRRPRRKKRRTRTAASSRQWRIIPALAPEAADPNGVPISALIFGGRRATTMPLVFQAFNWIHGVYIGATMASETTAAAAGSVGNVRRDPMAMLPFCGYNMGDYFRHWLRMRKMLKRPPKVFHVNWFRKSKDGKFLWPGYGENMRVLKWIVDRSYGKVNAYETPVGWMPEIEDIDTAGLSGEDIENLPSALTIDMEEWKREVLLQDDLFFKLYSDLPKELIFQRELLISRL